MPDLISQREAADILGVSERQVGRHRASGKLPFVKLGDGSVKIHRSHVERLVPRTAPRPTLKAPVQTVMRDSDELPPNLLRPIIRRAAA
jgi:excisionase family DNA binding protein